MYTNKGEVGLSKQHRHESLAGDDKVEVDGKFRQKGM
jgi:hypothetical protein